MTQFSFTLSIASLARTFAIWAHGDQKYGDLPYVHHLDEVVEVLKEYGYTDDDSLAAGYLHDVLEDSKIARYDDLGFVSQEVRYALMFCKDAEGHNRVTRKAATYERCHRDIGRWLLKPQCLTFAQDPDSMAYIPLAIRTKVADRIANVRSSKGTKSSLFHMYKKERDAFRLGLYTPGVCDAMWVEYDQLLGAQG